MKPSNALDDDQQAKQRLEALYDDEWMGLAAVRSESEGVLRYTSGRGAGRVGRIPALEVPQEDPSLVDEPGTPVTPPSFRRLVQRYGCDYVVRDGVAYVYAAENILPTEDIDMEGDA